MSRRPHEPGGGRTSRLTVLLVGEDSAGAQVLRALAQTKGVTVNVLTSGRGSGQGTSVAQVAAALGLLVLPAELVRRPEFAAWLRAHEVDLLLNVHSLFVVHPDVVEVPRIGSFNLHPGPLPRYAGLNAPSWALYNGESSFGVTLHWMDAGIDTGPVAFAETFAIDDSDTGLTLNVKCIKRGVELVSKVIEAAGAGAAIPRVEQDLTNRRYFGKGVPSGGMISWQRPAQDIVNFVRACDFLPFSSPWGHPAARLVDRDTAIVNAALTHERTSDLPGTVRPRERNDVVVAASDEWVSVRRVIVGGRVLPAAVALRPATEERSAKVSKLPRRPPPGQVVTDGGGWGGRGEEVPPPLGEERR